jgi:hypothetical protein
MRPARIVGPTTASIIDEPAARWLWPTLEAAAQTRGLRVERERDFTTGRGVAVLSLYRVQ